MTSDPEDGIEALRKRRAEHLAEFRKIYQSYRTWSISIGRVRIRAVMGTNLIAIVFVAWHVLAGAAGTLITILWTDNRELGVALIVGALFGFGSFMSQVWSQAMDTERELFVKVLDEDDLRVFRESYAELVRIDRKLEKLLAPGESKPTK